MYVDVVFAIVAIALWLGAVYLSGYGAALLSLVAPLIARKIWLVIRARQSKALREQASGASINEKVESETLVDCITPRNARLLGSSIIFATGPIRLVNSLHRCCAFGRKYGG